MNVKILRDLLPAAALEYAQAEKLHAAGFITEAGLRLGRAVEAALYAIARALNVSLTDLEIKKIEVIRKTLKEKGDEIIGNANDTNKVLRLAEISKSLSESIAYLINDRALREGAPTTEPRRMDALVRDLIRLVGDESTKARLGRQQSVLGAIRIARNKAAHANPSGEPRELSADEYQELALAVEELLSALVKIMIGIGPGEQSVKFGS